MRLRAALRSLRTLFGGWVCLAAAMDVSKTTITNFEYGSHPSTTYGLARRQRVAGTTMERLEPRKTVRSILYYLRDQKGLVTHREEDNQSKETEP
ncbi:hypothetical protein WME98_09650 [Sorangium sp. So ce296]|uniref:hypothetical protein n=1 Tax=Sorangium sp. So ce296 TaxID=3133296 RepID=UPI003F5F5596